MPATGPSGLIAVMFRSRQQACPPSPEELRVPWSRYLRATRTARPESYEAVEELAWRRLRSELDRLDAPLADADEQHFA